MDDIDFRQKFIMICGRRGSGKSEIMRFLYLKKRHLFHKTFVISPTDFSGFWQKLVGKENVFEKYDEEWINKLLDRMKSTNKDKDKKGPDFKNVLLILDDVFSGLKGHTLKSLHKIATSGRHYGLTLTYVIQWLTNVDPTSRGNSDLIFYGKCNKNSNEILEEEFNLGLSKQEFMDMCERCTNNHSFLVINNTASDMGNLNSVYGQMCVPENFINRKE